MSAETPTRNLSPPHGQPQSPRRRLTPEDVLNAVLRGDLDAVMKVFRRNRPLLFNIHGQDGCTPPLLACKHGHLDLAKFFFENGALISDHDRDVKVSSSCPFRFSVALRCAHCSSRLLIDQVVAVLYCSDKATHFTTRLGVATWNLSSGLSMIVELRWMPSTL